MSKENSCGMNALAIFTQESGGEPLTMSSREIAELTGKEHKHVMRDVRTLIDELSMSPNLDSCVKSTTYKGKDGRQYDQYELDKDTCLTLLLGYDAVARMKVVKRWRELEEFVAQPALNPDNLSRLQLIQAGFPQYAPNFCTTIILASAPCRILRIVYAHRAKFQHIKWHYFYQFHKNLIKLPFALNVDFEDLKNLKQ